MKIRDLTTEQDFVIAVKSAHYKTAYVISIEFTDGTAKDVDFESFLLNAKHTGGKKYIDNKEFQRFEIIDGNLNWGDYDMIFPVMDLYKSNVLKIKRPEAVSA